MKNITLKGCKFLKKYIKTKNYIDNELESESDTNSNNDIDIDIEE